LLAISGILEIIVKVALPLSLRVELQAQQTLIGLTERARVIGLAIQGETCSSFVFCVHKFFFLSFVFAGTTKTLTPPDAAPTAPYKMPFIPQTTVHLATLCVPPDFCGQTRHFHAFPVRLSLQIQHLHEDAHLLASLVMLGNLASVVLITLEAQCFLLVVFGICQRVVFLA